MTDPSKSPLSLDALTPGRAARLTLAAAVPLLLLLLAWHLRAVLLLAFAAVLVAIVIDGFARLLGRILPVPRGVRLAIAAISIVGMIGGIAYMFGSELEQQISQLIRLIPGGWQDLKDWLGEERVNGLAERLSPSGGSVISTIQALVSIISSALSGLFLALIGGIFLATRPNTYRNGLVMIAPRDWEGRVRESINAVTQALRAWLRGQLVSMIFVGVTIFAGLTAIGAPSPLALAVIAAVLGFIPVIGPLLAAIPAVLVGLTMGTDALPWIILLYFVVQNFDGNILNPLVMRHVVKLPPALTMFALFAVGAVFGPVGVLLGGPITVLCFVLVRHLWVADALGKELPG